MKNILNVIKENKNEEITVLLNNGNKGDGLIHEGGRNFFKFYNLNFKEIIYPQKASGNVLFVYGCGAFAAVYDHMVDFVNYYLKSFKKIVIMSASFDLRNKKVLNFIKTLPDNVEIFCRETYSFEQVVENIENIENVGLMDDFAFYVNWEKWKKVGTGKINAFRSDAESPIVIPNNIVNIDLASGTHNEWKQLLIDISMFNEVHTNRAHVSIASAMLGKETHIYPSTYHKQLGIYEYSLSGMENVFYHKNYNF